MALFYDNKGVLQYPNRKWAAVLGMWSPGGWVYCIGVWQRQVDVGLVLGLPCGGFALFCWGSWAHWGLHFLGSMSQCGALGTQVDGGGLGSLEFLLVPWPCGGFLMGVLSVGLSVFGPFCHIPLLMHGLSGH